MKYRIFLVSLCLLFVAPQAFSALVTEDSATGRIYSRARRFLVPYEAADSGPSGVAAVRLLYTTDGGRKWTIYGEKPEAKGSFEFVAPSDGVYGFTVQAIDNAGNSERKGAGFTDMAPEISVVVDTKSPQIEEIFPRGDLELAPGAHLRVRFRADDPNLDASTATIDFQKADAAEWTSVPRVDLNDGEFFGLGDTLFEGDYRVRLSVADRAGNRAETTYSFLCTKTPSKPKTIPGPIGQDWILPISAPPRAKSLVFDIDYQVADIGGLPPASVGLWYTSDSGATWQFYGLDPDVTTPFRFQAPSEGIYGFKLTATASSGVCEPAPRTGTKPDINTLVDVSFPSVMLDDPRGGESYAGGRVSFIKWTARDEHFSSLPISIYVSRDAGPWQLLAAELPNTGAYGWNVPLIDYATYRLKLEARDIVGNTTSVISDTFYVVSAPPETRIRGVYAAVEAVGIKEILGEADIYVRTPDPDASAVEPTRPPIGKSDAKVADLIMNATALRLRGDYEEAERVLREAVARDANSVESKNELGALLIQQGRHEESVEILKKARALAPGDTDVLYNLAAAYYALGANDEAVAAFRTLSRLDPTSPSVLWHLAQAQFAASDVTAARDTWRRLAVADAAGPLGLRARKALASIPAPQ